MRLIDSHSHLFLEEFAEDLPQVMARAREAGATIKNNMFVSSGTVFISSPQADNMKKQLHTRYSPKVMTWVICPLSTCLPENIRDTAMPTAIKVKNNPEFKVIPISLAYMAT